MNILKSRKFNLKSKQVFHTKLVRKLIHRFKNIFFMYPFKITKMVEQCQKIAKGFWCGILAKA